ncbi:hypothetical protein D9Q98_002648 [Chlorella vulgaris]|uniref:Uncharacterized protein n=1 Tax=Chlorella vulgaris TaxID=3077 RepID=A0A9D4TU90_CHLVU|nr:hypothetical protein D9Q98_002648 [Chlorella vulgaris]
MSSCTVAPGPLLRSAYQGAHAEYFSTTKKGEIRELKLELNAVDKSKKKDAVKKAGCAFHRSWVSSLVEVDFLEL